MFIECSSKSRILFTGKPWSLNHTPFSSSGITGVVTSLWYHCMDRYVHPRSVQSNPGCKPAEWSGHVWTQKRMRWYGARPAYKLSTQDEGMVSKPSNAFLTQDLGQVTFTSFTSQIFFWILQKRRSLRLQERALRCLLLYNPIISPLNPMVRPSGLPRLGAQFQWAKRLYFTMVVGAAFPSLRLRFPVLDPFKTLYCIPKYGQYTKYT